MPPRAASAELRPTGSICAHSDQIRANLAQFARSGTKNAGPEGPACLRELVRLDQLKVKYLNFGWSSGSTFGKSTDCLLPQFSTWW